ncbi:gamma-glutamyltranspeptidase/glutathione hydrolase [Palleronia aestuarii]|uniref:Gamma-glutamyltranspeptidase/glutathione hydrolase n=1 Tax=Palleronia aestuarii TaxID=568105 RepID=A0A2W7Q5T5_9RHOB|nr:gamma-glutamyltransferase [Palleronia aestuarii]PZX17089.1 gamma-glutamyltranspeptidase/glutathione hydrolase [Palleronia aestuarii]
MHNFSTTQVIRKIVRQGAGGVVAAQHKIAARAGARVLAEGGDAIDAAVATSFAIGIVEPWMSGPMGGGMMNVWRAGAEKAETIQFGMRSPAGLDPAEYPIERGRKASDLFPWPAVEGDRNIRGGTAVAVPGTVAGIALAHEIWGTRPWAELLAPAIELAREGMQVDWYASLLIASEARDLARDPDAAAMFLVDGQWPIGESWTALSDARLDQGKAAETLARLAEAGPRDFYEGDIAAALVSDVQAKGGSLALSDLAEYRARRAPSLEQPYRDGRVMAPSGFSAGTELAQALAQMEGAFTPGDGPDAESYGAMADALDTAYARRLAEVGDTGEDDRTPACTTSFSIVDRAGNMVSVTQTLLSMFGAHVVSPSTGYLLNNGIMWFDPEPAKPNSLAPSKACLMNVCPTLGEGPAGRFAIGASGGRKILPAVANLTSFFLDHGMDLETAFHHPRIDVSGSGPIVADEALPKEVLDGLRSRRDVVEAPRGVHPYAFAVPAGVMRKDGSNSGCTEIMTPWGDAVHEDEV